MKCAEAVKHTGLNCDNTRCPYWTTAFEHHCDHIEHALLKEEYDETWMEKTERLGKIAERERLKLNLRIRAAQEKLRKRYK